MATIVPKLESRLFLERGTTSSKLISDVVKTEWAKVGVAICLWISSSILALASAYPPGAIWSKRSGSGDDKQRDPAGPTRLTVLVCGECVESVAGLDVRDFRLVHKLVADFMRDLYDVSHHHIPTDVDALTG